MLLVLLKTTLLFALALGCLPLMRRASSKSRHLICACAMAGALLMPLTMLAPPAAAPIRLSTITFFPTSEAALGGSPWGLSKTIMMVMIPWAAGLVVLVVRLGIGYCRLGIVLRTATPGNGFLISDVPVPIVAGLWRPVILMPRSAEFWPSSQRVAALKHEQAHVERHDLLTNLMADLACAVYWFHPLAWAVARRLRYEQETACDDAVLCSGFEAASYAEALIATAREITSDRLVGCSMAKSALKPRIARLFESGLARTSSSAALRATAMVFVLAAAPIALLNCDADRGRVYTMKDGVSAPRVLYKVDPEYSEEARRAKLAGPVLLQFVVDAEGRARDIQVVRSLGMGLDEKALEAVRKWTFAPGRKDGAPVSVRAKIEMNFHLL